VGWDPAPDMQRSFGYGSYESVMETLAGALSGRTYIAGDRFSAADVYLASHIGLGLQFGIIGKRPEFEAYCEGLLSRPAAARARDQAEKLAAQAAWAES
jgi:glutathione S-transferase